MNTFERILAGMIALLFGMVIVAQAYRAGERNARLTVPLEISDGYQQGHTDGFESCQDQF